MSPDRYEAQQDLCAERHTPIGTIGWPVPYEPDDAGPHASTQVCERAACQDAASRWVQEHTGHDGAFRSFADAREGRSARLVPVPAHLACMTCTSTIERDQARGKGWLADEYPTSGGPPVKVVICFPCRQRIANAEADREPCRGSCKGDYGEPDGWRATCTWLGHCDEKWSCWDEDCVREWAAEHVEPRECGECGQSTWHEVVVKRISELRQSVGGTA